MRGTVVTVVFLRVRTTDPDDVAEALAEHGYRVLGVYGSARLAPARPDFA